MSNTSYKNQILIISEDNILPEGLEQAVEQLEVDSKICRPQDALEELKDKQLADAVILTLQELEQLEDESLKQITDQIKTLSVNMLVISGEVTDSRVPSNYNDKGIFHACHNESGEMLKGRLATLLELQSRLRDLTCEVEMFRTFNQPVNSQFNQMDEEMRLAARLQRDFLPKQLSQIKGLRFACVFRPATWVSGDIYDVMRLDEEHVGFYVADVVGHGMPAALLTMFIKRAMVTKRISGNKYSIIEPGEVLEQLNIDLLAQGLSEYQFVTCCYALLNTKTRQMRIANAGHPLPIRITRQGELQELEVRGTLLGILADQKYQTENIQLENGDKLLLYSDGAETAFITEETEGSIHFPKEDEHLSSSDIQSICDGLVDIIERKVGPEHPRDDVTIVGMEIEND